MPSAGWRMRANNAGRGGLTAKGFAELKRLRKAAESVAAASTISSTQRSAAKNQPGAVRSGAEGRGRPAPQAPQEGVLSREDKALFRQAVKSVAPIRDTRRAILGAFSREPPDILRQRRERAMGSEPLTLSAVSDHYSPMPSATHGADFLQRGYGPDLLKHLRRGKWLIGASLDLHGNTLDQARERLDRFLQSCVEHQIKCVRVVHGKGHGSKDGEAVLKQTVRRWLSQMDSVLAYIECAEQDGGAGAVQVLLRIDHPTRQESP